MKTDRYIVAYDTICTGWDCIRDGNGDYYIFTKEEAEAEIQEDIEERGEDSDLFIVHESEYIHERKAIFNPK